MKKFLTLCQDWVLGKPSAAWAGLRIALLSFDQSGRKAKNKTKRILLSLTPTYPLPLSEMSLGRNVFLTYCELCVYRKLRLTTDICRVT